MELMQSTTVLALILSLALPLIASQPAALSATGLLLSPQQKSNAEQVAPSAFKAYKGMNQHLKLAMDQGRAKEVWEILQANPQAIEYCDEFGRTPLVRAAQTPHANVVKEILSHHPNVNHQDHRNWTALMHACLSADKNIVALLLQANANTAINTGNSPCGLKNDKMEPLAPCTALDFAHFCYNVNAKNVANNSREKCAASGIIIQQLKEAARLFAASVPN